MEALNWLSRSSNFLSDKLANELIEAFRDTEVPFKDLDIRGRYINQLTDSQAGLNICEVLGNALAPNASLPDELRRYYDEAGISKDALTKKGLIWPLKVLEMLICNNE